jgi:hypothetical protein
VNERRKKKEKKRNNEQQEICLVHERGRFLIIIYILDSRIGVL